MNSEIFKIKSVLSSLNFFMNFRIQVFVFCAVGVGIMLSSTHSWAIWKPLTCGLSVTDSLGQKVKTLPETLKVPFNEGVKHHFNVSQLAGPSHLDVTFERHDTHTTAHKFSVFEDGKELVSVFYVYTQGQIHFTVPLSMGRILELRCNKGSYLLFWSDLADSLALFSAESGSQAAEVQAESHGRLWGLGLF